MQRLSSVSRTHIETGIYFRWDGPDDDSDQSAACSLLNNARLGSYVYADDDDAAGPPADVSGPSWLGGEVLEDTAATDNSSTDGNNNDVSGMSDGAPSSPGQHVVDASPPRDAEVVVSAVLKIFISPK